VVLYIEIHKRMARSTSKGEMITMSTAQLGARK